MIPKPIAQITFGDLQALVGHAAESKTLEFKREPSNKDADKQFLKGVSALANTAGGDFVLGVDAADGVASSVSGIPVANLDQERLRIENLLRDGLEPRLPRAEIGFVDCGAGDRYVLIVRVSHSWVGPHRLKSDNHFYARNSAGTYPLDVGELRTSIVLSETGAERIRAFRAGRLGKIAAGETPVPLMRTGAVVLHVVPVPSFMDRQLFDVVGALENGSHFPLPLDGPNGGNQALVNLDGIVNYAAAGGDKTSSYGLLFRSGAIEAVSLIGLEADETRYVAGEILARKIADAVRGYLALLNSIEMPFPVYVMLSLCGAAGCRLKYVMPGGPELWTLSDPLDRDIVALPEIAIDRHDADIPQALRPMFDMLWNGFGFLRCDMYDARGVWRGR